MNIKSILVSTLVITLLLSPILAAHIFWRIEPIRHLPLRVVDYSVPNDTYWNHKGLFWLLNHLRILEPTGQDDWLLAQHYIGYDPRGRGKGTRISEAALDDVDWLYLSDTYGVHISDRKPGPDDVVDRGFIFGGLSVDDAEALRVFADDGGSIISEFNSLAGPTSREARQILSDIMGIEWLGWSGRFVPSFAEVPHQYAWFEQLYRQHYGDAPLPTGHGMMLIHEDGRLIVLKDAVFERSMPTLALSPHGRDWMQTPVGTPPYYGWFGVINDKGESDVLANIIMPTPDNWEATFRQKGVPRQFPLVTRKDTPHGTYIYIAANISIVDEVPTHHELAFLPKILSTIHRRRDSVNHGPAYWQFFVPVVGKMLTDAARVSSSTEEAN